MATHSSILAWKIPWTEEPGRLQYMGLQIHLDKTEQLNLNMNQPLHLHFKISQFKIFSFGFQDPLEP